MKWLILIFSLLLLTAFALYNAVKNQNLGSYNFLCLCFIALMISVYTGPLGYRIGGQHLILEEKITQIKNQNEDLQKAASTLTKMIYVTIDSITNKPWDYVPEQHLKKLKEYKESLVEYLPTGFEAELSNDLKELNPQDR